METIIAKYKLNKQIDDKKHDNNTRPNSKKMRQSSKMSSLSRNNRKDWKSLRQADNKIYNYSTKPGSGKMRPNTQTTRLKDIQSQYKIVKKWVVYLNIIWASENYSSKQIIR